VTFFKHLDFLSKKEKKKVCAQEENEQFPIELSAEPKTYIIITAVVHVAVDLMCFCFF
jgi:hypothetical protein